jgi:deoxyribodipyrimidine photo-lyase
MPNLFENGLFIFRRDLRIIDNNALNMLNDKCKNIYTIFIFTPEQVGNKNDYKSDNAVQFMIESLQNLSSEINKKKGKLYTFYGDNEKIIKQCIETLNIDIVCFNLDYTPYAKERDSNIIKMCKKMETYVVYDYDYYLNEPETILNSSGKPYQKFTPYYQTALKTRIKTPAKMRKIHFGQTTKHLENTITLNEAMNRFTKTNPNKLVKGGRDEALKQIKIAAKNIKNYGNTRDILAKPTSLLSAYIKFGCVSIREVYHTFHSNREFIRQLYWRDFYGQLLFYNPHIIGHAMYPKYDKIKWNHNEKWLDAWKTGKTGFPIVDASMRQLNHTGWTHNRGRMIASSILAKIFMIHWKKGEQYYSQKLTDYDVANNNGGWQWSAGSGVDAQPWFRFFNPFLQSKEHDPECEYIKTWIPELRDVPNEAIHNWNEEHSNYKESHYPKPIVDFKEQKEKSLKMYKEALN